MEEDLDIPSDEGDFGKLSRINSAGLVNSMLHNLWQDFFRHIRNADNLSANNDLDCIWTILGGEKKVTEKIEDDFKTIQKRLPEYSENNILVEKGFRKPDIRRLVLYAKHKSVLMEKALFLRKLQNSQGKGTAYQDEDEGDFD